MHSKELIDLVRATYQEQRSIRKTAEITKQSPSSVAYMISNNYERPKKKRGRRPALSPRENLAIKREVKRIKSAREKVTARKLKENLELTSCERTIRRKLHKLGMKYKNDSKKIHLTKRHKDERVRIVSDWLARCHDWKITVFTDEKKFNLDGPDSWMTWMDENENSSRDKRQMGGGSIMIWGMLLPQGEIAVFRVHGKMNSTKYIDFLEEQVSPVLLDKFRDGFFVFQQDNASIHVAKQSMMWLNEHFPMMLEWPAKSPDLSPQENVWKMISDIVYDGPPYSNTNDLMKAIENAVKFINEKKSDVLLSLVEGMNQRCIKVLVKKGDIIN